MAPEQVQGVAEALRGKIALGRFGTADEIAVLASMLCCFAVRAIGIITNLSLPVSRLED